MQINYLIDLICMERETVGKHLTKVKNLPNTSISDRIAFLLNFLFL